MQFVIRKKVPTIVSYSLCNIVGKVLVGKKVGAFTLFPFIIFRDRGVMENEDYIRHETIHLRQYVETLFIRILVIGYLQYLYARCILKKSKLQAYCYMSHEQEAHQNDRDQEYLKNRKWFTYYKYLNPKNKRKIDFVNEERIIS